MLRRLLRIFAPLIAALALCAPAVQAQTTPAPEAENSESSTSALPYTVLIVFTLIILSIVCVPSRKA